MFAATEARHLTFVYGDANQTDGGLVQARELESESLRYLKKILYFTEGYVILGVLIVGIVGNLLSFVIFVRARRRRDATVQYLSVLSVADLGVLIFYGIMTNWLDTGLRQVTKGKYSIVLWLMSDFLCKIIAFTTHVFECLSAWIIVAFSIERAFVVWFPLKRASITQKKRMVIITAILITAVGVSLHRLILFQIYLNHFEVCFYYVPSLARVVLYQLDICVYNYIPGCLILISNIMILVGIGWSKFDSKIMTAKSTGQDRKVIVSLLSVSTLFIILLTPASAAYTYYALTLRAPDEDPRFARFLQYLAQFLGQVSQANYSINFIVYGLTLPFYRKELKKMFRSCAGHRLGPSHH